MLRFLVDEDLPRSTARVLREHGYEAQDVRDMGLRGSTDSEVFARAQSLSAVLLTADIDFANILRFPPGSHFGIVVSRIPDELSTAAINSEILKALKELATEDIARAIVILEPGQIRIRR